MLTLLGSLLGFGGSLVPAVLKHFSDKSLQNHQIALMEQKLKWNKIRADETAISAQRAAEALEAQALYRYDQATGKFAESLRASVRPLLTYGFFALFSTVKIMAFLRLERQNLAADMAVLWDPATQTLFATIISFWFGHRTFQRPHR